MILQFKKLGMRNEKGFEAVSGELDSERAIRISALDNELASAIRQKQDLEARATKVAKDFNTTLPMILDSQIQVIRVRQKITNLLLCRLLIILDEKREINVEGITSLLE